MIEINQILKNLAERRSVFHSEADFQHSLAWEIHQYLPNANIRLELPIQVRKQGIHLDLWITEQTEITAVELKYKTRLLSACVGNEQYSLKSQNAQDIGRYDFLKDVQRLEYVVNVYNNCKGYAILLTNDSSYWDKSPNHNTVDSDFRLNDHRNLEGPLCWGAGTSNGTKKGREQPLTLQHKYCIQWENYSRINLIGHNVFRSLTIKVERETGVN